MNSLKPFIHLIKTPYSYYFYDVNFNSIVKINEEIYKYLKHQQKDMLSEEDKNNMKVKLCIERMNKEGLLSNNRVQSFNHEQDSYLEYWIDNKIQKITLQLTQQCNFRCSYCVYSETDNTKQRSHSIKKMDLVVAKKGLEFLLQHSRDSAKVDVGFYGGEPLLEFELLKQCVEYAENIFEGKQVSFSITTNGSLLNDKVVEFLQEKRFSVMISLDGPKEIHNRHRRFATNGCGTFDAIDNTLQKIKVKYPEYFKTFSFNVVVNPQDDYGCLNSFLKDYSLFKEVSVRSSLIDDTYSDEKLIFSKEYINENKYERFKMLLSYMGRVSKYRISPIVFQELNKLIDLKKNMVRSSGLPEQMSHSGPCIPGVLRLFINTDGNLYPCERVSESSEVMKIGNLSHGFNIKKVRSILNIGNLTADRCKNCWAINFCSLCAKHADNCNELSAKLKLTHCKNTIRNADIMLKDFIGLNEVSSIFKVSGKEKNYA